MPWEPTNTGIDRRNQEGLSRASSTQFTYHPFPLKTNYADEKKRERSEILNHDQAKVLRRRRRSTTHYVSWYVGILARVCCEGIHIFLLSDHFGAEFRQLGTSYINKCLVVSSRYRFPIFHRNRACASRTRAMPTPSQHFFQFLSKRK